MNKKIIIYTDGACRGNPGPGGWGVVFQSQGVEDGLLNGYELETTNNRMELKAAIHALLSLNGSYEMELYTDSQYLRLGMTQWMASWKRKGWKNAKREPVKNQDLWRRLDDLVVARNIVWHWVKGHSGHPGNDKADALANAAIDAQGQSHALTEDWFEHL